MANLEYVPVVEVNRDNLTELWPAIILAIKSSTFIAVDTELSGLGNRKLLNAKIIDERYQHTCEVARSRSIVALGVSCFKLQLAELNQTETSNHLNTKKLTFQVQTFNMMLLCSEEYTVEPASLKFLVDHGFDFNLQYSKGLPYMRGDDKEKEAEQSVRKIFTEIILSQAPLVLHNAFVDLVFLYHNLYASVPNSQQAFIADLALMFPAGVYDTKYITDFKARIGASYLEYVFKKCQRGNMVSNERGWSHMELVFLQYTSSDYIKHMPCHLNIGQHKDTTEDQICLQYANHGWCPTGAICSLSHDIDVILDVEERPKSKPVRSLNVSVKEYSDSDITSNRSDSPKITNSTSSHLPGKPTISINKAGSHRAGFDAFMTGYIFAFFASRYGAKDLGEANSSLKGAELGMAEYQNKLYLVGKDIPLHVTKSSFAKPSKGHNAKMARINPP